MRTPAPDPLRRALPVYPPLPRCPFQVERLPLVLHCHAPRHLPHVRLPQKAAAAPQEEEGEEDGLAGRHLQRRRRDEGEIQRQKPKCVLLHWLRKRHQR